MYFNYINLRSIISNKFPVLILTASYNSNLDSFSLSHESKERKELIRSFGYRSYANINSCDAIKIDKENQNFSYNIPRRREKLVDARRLPVSQLDESLAGQLFLAAVQSLRIVRKTRKVSFYRDPTGYLAGKPNNLFPRFHLSFFLLPSSLLPFLSLPFPSLPFPSSCSRRERVHRDADTSKIGRITRRQNVFRSVPLSRIVARNYVITILGLADGV